MLNRSTRLPSGEEDHQRDDRYAACIKKGAPVSGTIDGFLVELVFKEIMNCLERGKSVSCHSSVPFCRNKRQRMGRKPKTGEKTPIPARRVLVFKPSDVLKQRNQCSTSSSSLITTPPHEGTSGNYQHNMSTLKATAMACCAACVHGETPRIAVTRASIVGRTAPVRAAFCARTRRAAPAFHSSTARSHSVHGMRARPP